MLQPSSSFELAGQDCSGRLGTACAGNLNAAQRSRIYHSSNNIEAYVWGSTSIYSPRRINLPIKVPLYNGGYKLAGMLHAIVDNILGSEQPLLQT